MLRFFSAILATCYSVSLMAAGPLVLEGPDGHVPVTYLNPNIELNIETGSLGLMTNDIADQMVRDAIAIWNNVSWNNVSTSTINLTQGLDVPVDIDGSNFSSYLDNDSDRLNPVVYDDDGSIIDAFFGDGAKDSVVGFAASSYLVNSSHFIEGFVVITGHLRVPPGMLKLIVAHEIGHYFGLDHTQANIDNTETLDDLCPTPEADYPLMYPYACRESEELHPDDVVSISMLYPESDYFERQGQLTGRLVTPEGFSVRGANVWLENTSTGDVYSVVSDYLRQGTGFFALMLPPGSYTLHANSINSEFYGGSSVGPYAWTPTDFSFLPPASTIGSVVFAADGPPPAIVTLAAGESVNVEFRTDGSGSINASDTQVDLIPDTLTSDDGGGGSPSLPLLATLLGIPALRIITKLSAPGGKRGLTRMAIDPPTRVTSSGKRREYVRVGSTAASLPPTFPTEATRVGLNKCH